MRTIFALGVIVGIFIASASAGVFDPPPAKYRVAREVQDPLSGEVVSNPEDSAPEDMAPEDTQGFMELTTIPDTPAESSSLPNERTTVNPPAAYYIRKYRPGGLVLPSPVPI
ncbi:uncharacterized protein LOC135223262 [Macrobrachium nipponense]|uniref:uncharacterized protein LOC135223262 n=1 Tax=Macrobrachium nipponense TaxID=159736 RepID=UPI0030C88AD3